MKKLLLLAIAAMAANSTYAEIHENYAAPLLGDVQITDLQPYFMFKAPPLGGTIWASNISNENPMGGLNLMSGNVTFYNGGMNGMQLCEKPSLNTFALGTPILKLEAGKLFHITYKDAGTRSSQNKSITLNLVRVSTKTATSIDSYELQPCTDATNYAMYEHDYLLCAPETADDYYIEFYATSNGKSAGVFLQEVAITEDAPEGRGDLKGYNIYYGTEKQHYFPANEAEEGAVYLTYTYTEKVNYDTPYDFALQAVYEGGESPLSNVVTKTYTTPTGIISTTTNASAHQYFNLSGLRTSANAKGIMLQSGKKVVK